MASTQFFLPNICPFMGLDGWTDGQTTKEKTIYLQPFQEGDIIRTRHVYKVQWNHGNSNASFSKLPDFSKTTDGPEFFHYNLLQKYHRFFEFQFFEKINFSNRFVGPKQRNSY